MQLIAHMRERPRMLVAIAAGAVTGALVPHVDRLTARVLVGWNVGVWLLLILLGWMMLQADHERMRRRAVAQAESAPVVLMLVIVAAVVSLVAIVGELAAAKQSPGGGHEIGHVLFALTTVAGSWLLLPTLFALNYATIYYTGGDGRDDGEEDVDNPGAGLEFPDRDADPGFRPDYADFLYFSYTIAVACQTADIAISTRPMRRLALLQALLSFIFNTTILALTINIAAGLF